MLSACPNRRYTNSLSSCGTRLLLLQATNSSARIAHHNQSNAVRRGSTPPKNSTSRSCGSRVAARREPRRRGTPTTRRLELVLQRLARAGLTVEEVRLNPGGNRPLTLADVAPYTAV